MKSWEVRIVEKGCVDSYERPYGKKGTSLASSKKPRGGFPFLSGALPGKTWTGPWLCQVTNVWH